MRKAKKICFLLICFIFIPVASLSWGQDTYPNKPIQLVCPYAPGGTSDITGRVVGEKMGQLLGQPIIVLNKTGGGATLGVSYVAGAKPDGYTLLTVPSSFIIPPLITPDLPYKTSDFVPIGRLVSFNRLILVNKDFPAKNLPEFVAYARKNPKTLSYSGSETGGINHLVGLLLNLDAGLDLQFIPYAGENPGMMALLGSHVQMSIVQVSQALPHIKSNAIRALAVLYTKRDSLVPQVPTSVEQGYPDLVAPSYHVFLAPAKTPQAVVKKLEAALEKALQDKQVREKLEKIELAVDFKNSQDTLELMNAETKKWSTLVKRLNFVIK